MAQRCNSFLIVPETNGTVCLCLDPGGLKQVLTGQVHRGPKVEYILAKLTETGYITLIDVSMVLYLYRL